MSKFTKIFVGLMAAVMMVSASSASAAALTQSQIDAIISLLQSFGADATTVANVQASLTGGTPTTPTTPTTGITFSVNLKMGDSGADVKNLQIVLNKDAATQIASTGAGSPGSESTYFGALTKAAVIKFQEKYASEVLTPAGLAAGTGFVGALTRAKLNAVAGGTTTGGGTTGGGTTVPAGTGITVSSPSQPTATLAPEGSARVPFTKVTLTAGNDGDVVVNSVAVERTGLAHDAVFSGVVLLDDTGKQLGIAKTFGSNHQANVGEAVTIAKGTSRTFTIAGNMAASLDSYAGEVPYLSVIGVNTSATVTGALPVTGAGHTINATLAIGSVTMTRGPLDPNGAQSKNVGTSGVTFSSIKMTAGSAEKVRVLSIRWNQASSSAASDLGNLKTYVDGTGYDTTVSSDGKYYTSTFGSGILVDKGNSAEISIKGDIVSGSGRTVAFNVEKTTDLYLVGDTYGYGITPPTSGTGFTSGTIWYAASTFTINQGTITVSKGASVAAANVTVALANQPLGGFDVEVKGESITVSSMAFTIATSSGTGAGVLTQVSLYDASGAVVAGPADADAAGTTVTLTDAVTFPVGTKTYTLKGKVASTIGNNTTYSVSLNPSTAWTNVVGQTTGSSITVSPNSTVTANTMTVKAASLTISVSSNPPAQTVVAGVNQFTFANYQLDASGSGEDVKISAIPLEYNASGTATNITNCNLFDGATQLTSGSNTKNPSAAASSTNFTLDNYLTIPKGTIKTVALKCNVIASAAAAAYAWGYDSSSSPSATGLTSGQSITVGETDSMGQLMTVSTGGTLTVTLDAATSPSYKVTAAGTTGNTMSVLKFHAANEAITLQKIHLQLTNTASSSASDLANVTLWDGAVQIGTASFVSNGTLATSTLSTPVTIPKDGDKLITVKADFTNIGISEPATEGHLIAIDYNGGDTGSTQGIGQSSGNTITTSGSTNDTASAGVRIFKTYPTLAKMSAGSSKVTSGNLSLYRFSVTAAPQGDVGISKFTIRIASTSATAKADMVDNVNVYGFSDSAFSNPIVGIGNSGEFMNTAVALSNWADSSSDINVYAQTTAAASTTVQVPAGATRYFEVRGDVTVAGTTYSVSTQIQGDAKYLAGLATSTFMDTAATVDADANGNDNFIWSPNATSTVAVTAADWANGFGLSGLPGTNMQAEILSQ